MKSTSNPLPTLALAAALLAAHRASPAGLIRDPGFDVGPPAWHVPAALGSWNPFADGVASLNPPFNSYGDPVLYQNLNVPVAPGQTLAVQARLRRQYSSIGDSVTLSADVLDALGQSHRVVLLSPATDTLVDGEFVAVQGPATLPPDAARLVRLVVSRSGYGSYSIDDVGLDGPGLAPGPVPRIDSIIPAAAPYSTPGSDSMVTLKGSGFGGKTGSARLALSPFDQPNPFGGSGNIPVVSWTPDTIVLRVAEPARTGKVWVLADGVESDGEPQLAITSPNFTVDVVDPKISRVRGQIAEVVCRVAFLNGFSSAGGVRLMSTLPIPGAVSEPLFGTGGAVLRLDTSSLAPGIHAGSVQSLEDKSMARFAPYELEVSTVAAIHVYEWDSSTGLRVELQAKTNHAQGLLNLQFEATNPDGTVLGAAGAQLVDVSSSNPGVVAIYPGNFGPQIYAAENGSATLTLRTPDGFSRSFPVTVDAPTAPRVLSMAIVPQTVANDGVQTISFGATATESVTVGYMGALTLVDDQIEWSDSNRSANRTFRITPGTTPGDYLFTAGTGGWEPRPAPPWWRCAW